MEQLNDHVNQPKNTKFSVKRLKKLTGLIWNDKRSRALIFVIAFGVIGSLLLSLSFAQKPEKNKQQSRGIRGEVAIERLENRLPEVASRYNMAPQRLRELFLNDPTLELTDDDQLIYVEPALSQHEIEILESGVGESTTPSTTGESASLTDTPIIADRAFELDSLPTSDKTLYLDFDGHTTTESHWTKYNDGNTIVSAPYDHDGNPASFSQSEREAIIDIWSAVSEDFAPFNINVTTKDPGSAALVKSSTDDTAYGNRVIISPTKDWYGSAGGVAYVNTIGQPKEYVAFVFICCSTGSSKNIAEATSHELGHSLGLHHDGTTTGTTYYRGHGDWAPIMGSGYYEPITQWSKGEYNAANNTEDDLTLPLKNGLIHRPDEAGNSITGASPLNLSSNPLKRAYIGTTGDIDVYAFSWPGGVATFTASSLVYTKYFPIAGNLDPSLRLLNSSGGVVAASDPAGAVAATVSKDIPAGTYYLEVSGTAYLDPLTTGYSNYATLGGYLLTTQTTATSPSNVAPTAKAAVTPNSGSAPLGVTFSSNGSVDPENKALSYKWTFGDGNTSIAANPSHTYSSPGNYIATLTVTDDGGLSSQASVSVTATSNSTVITINNITGGRDSVTGRNGRTENFIGITITVTTASGQPVSNATVTGNWSGVTTGSGTGITGSDGKVYIRSKSLKKRGSVTFTTTNVTPNNTLLNYQWDGLQKSITVTY